MYFRLATFLSLYSFVVGQTPPEPKIISITKQTDGSCGYSFNAKYVPLDFTKRNCLLIHGHSGVYNDPQFWTMANNYEKQNCIAYYIFWGPLAQTPLYNVLSQNLDFVAGCVYQFFGPLIDSQIEPPYLHVIGHSFGAHIAGYFGYKLWNGIDYKLNRITGLDPANKQYVDILAMQHLLSPTDALIVIHMHTNDCLAGTFENLGTLNIRMNDGCNQPGCNIINLTDLSVFSLAESHLRALDYQIESIISNKFVFYKCSMLVACVPIIYTNDVQATGTYTLCTNSTSPYGLGDCKCCPYLL